MRVTPFLCRLHRSAFRCTGRITGTDRHNQDIGVMGLPSGGLADLRDRCALSSLEHRNYLGLLAVVTRAWLGCKIGLSRLNHCVQCRHRDGRTTRYPQRFVALSGYKPTCAVGRDQRPVEEAVENFLSGTALEGLGIPEQFAIRVDGGVVED